MERPRGSGLVFRSSRFGSAPALRCFFRALLFAGALLLTNLFFVSCLKKEAPDLSPWLGSYAQDSGESERGASELRLDSAPRGRLAFTLRLFRDNGESMELAGLAHEKDGAFLGRAQAFEEGSTLELVFRREADGRILLSEENSKLLSGYGLPLVFASGLSWRKGAEPTSGEGPKATAHDGVILKAGYYLPADIGEESLPESLSLLYLDQQNGTVQAFLLFEGMFSPQGAKVPYSLSNEGLLIKKSSTPQKNGAPSSILIPGLWKIEAPHSLRDPEARAYDFWKESLGAE